MEHSKKPLKVFVAYNNKAPDLSVCLSIPYHCDSNALRHLKGNQSGCPDASTSLAFALFEKVREKLAGTPLEAMKHKVNYVNCSSQNGYFTINWNTASNGSALRKTLVSALSVMAPEKLNSNFSENQKMANEKVVKDNKEKKDKVAIQPPTKEVFKHCAEQMRKAIDKEILCVAVGKAKVKKDKLKDCVEKAVAKLPKKSTIGGKAEKPKDVKCVCDHPKIKAVGLNALVVADYISSKSGGMGVEVHNDGVVVFNKAFESKKKSIAENKKIKDYVVKKYAKLKAHLPLLLSQLAIVNGWASAKTIHTILKTKTKPAVLEKNLKKSIHK